MSLPPNGDDNQLISMPSEATISKLEYAFRQEGVWTKEELADLRAMARFMKGMRAMGSVWDLVIRIVQITGAIAFLIAAIRSNSVTEFARAIGEFFRGASGK